MKIKPKAIIKLLISSLIFLFVFICSVTFNTSIASALTNNNMPVIGIFCVEQYPFIKGCNNSIIISTNNYNEDIQYQFFYKANTENDMKLIDTKDTINGWTKPMKAYEPYKFDISHLNLDVNDYKFIVRIKRTGITGKYESDFGNYDCYYTLTFSVIDNPKIDIRENEYLTKDEYCQYEHLTFEADMLCKINLYDPLKNQWLLYSSDYKYKIDYSLNNIPTGKYLVKISYKNDKSIKDYDGWKIYLIDIKENFSITDLLGEEISSNISLNCTREQSKIQKDLFNYLMDEDNRLSVYNTAIRLNGGSESNSCVCFASEALRRAGVKIPNGVRTTGQPTNGKVKSTNLTYTLLNSGWKINYDISMLLPSDICFTTPYGGGKGKPTHSYIFMGWVDENSTDYAYVCDNQTQDYGTNYHVRNIKNATPDKEAFYYSMYKTTD